MQCSSADAFQVVQELLAQFDGGGAEIAPAQAEAWLVDLGLMPIAGEWAPWLLLGESAWHALTHGLTRIAPAVGIALVRSRLMLERAPPLDGGWIEGALAPADRTARDLTRGCRVCLLGGATDRLLAVTRQHVHERPMFRRVLGDFPLTRWRLARLDAQRMKGRFLIRALLRGTGPTPTLLGALYRSAQTVRRDSQQLCGGTGHMLESAYAQALLRFDDCLGFLRAEEMVFEPLPADLSSALAVHLDQHFLRVAGSPAPCALAPWVLSSPGP